MNFSVWPVIHQMMLGQESLVISCRYIQAHFKAAQKSQSSIDNGPYL